MEEAISGRLNRQISDRTSFDFVRYANCWEDADVLVAALKPREGARILSIASAGDNVLSLLAEGAEVVAIDISRAQLACLELRCAAFRHLEYSELLGFLGVHPHLDRLSVYHRLKSDLSGESSAYWDAQQSAINCGCIHAGKFEDYFRLFRTRILPLIHSQRRIEQLLVLQTAEERLDFWNSHWNNWRWRLLFRLFFSRTLMGRLGRDPEFFRYVQGSIAEQTMARARYAMTTLSTRDNPYLTYIATGNYRTALPRYLRPEFYEPIRLGLERLTILHGPIDSVTDEFTQGYFDGMNLSDVFEYMSEELAATVYGKLLGVAAQQARIAYWQTFVPRNPADRFPERARPLQELSAELFSRDKAFFYGHFQVDETLPS